jgi:hypothetical protein
MWRECGRRRIMARRTITIDEKIKNAEAEVLNAKAKYDAAVEKLDALIVKKREIESKELLKAFEKSDRSLEEILAFLGKTEAE